jgi:NAD+ kinase
MERDELVEISYDGDASMQLAVGDRIVIRKSGASTKFLKLSNRSFLEILRKKMQEHG